MQFYSGHLLIFAMLCKLRHLWEICEIAFTEIGPIMPSKQAGGYK